MKKKAFTPSEARVKVGEKPLFLWRGQERRLGKPAQTFVVVLGARAKNPTMPKQMRSKVPQLINSEKRMLLLLFSSMNTTSLHRGRTQEISIIIKLDQFIDS